jgi:hypothetical protein
MISISEEELIGLLEKAYEEGWYGSKDMGEIVAQTLVADIKQPEYTESGGLTKKLLKEANSYSNRYASNGEHPLAGGHPAPQPIDDQGNTYHELSYLHDQQADMLNYGWSVNAAPPSPPNQDNIMLDVSTVQITNPCAEIEALPGEDLLGGGEPPEMLNPQGL